MRTFSEACKHYSSTRFLISEDRFPDPGIRYLWHAAQAQAVASKVVHAALPLLRALVRVPPCELDTYEKLHLVRKSHNLVACESS